MPIRVEAYTAGGILTGLIARSGSIRDVLEGSTSVAIGSSRWLPLDGSDEQASGEVELAVDDLILVVAEATEDDDDECARRPADLNAASPERGH